MTDKQNESTHDSLDRLLDEGMLKPPDNFTETVLHSIAQQAPYDYSQQAAPDTSKTTLWTSLALAASTAVGVFQVIGFVFGLWMPAATG